jgi:proteasome lid subunit RPN8/RPN11
MVGHCYDGFPLEACGLLAGPPDSSDATVCYPTRNAARSSRVYEVHGIDYRDADDDAEANGLELLGVFHSHTHTDPYPSRTDVAAALFPQWHYVLVSLRDEAPMTRSFRIVDGKISEEPVVLIGG